MGRLIADLDLAVTARLWRGDLTQEEAAEQVGISHVTYRRVEQGESVRPGTLVKLAVWLRVPVELLTGERRSEDACPHCGALASAWSVDSASAASGLAAAG